MLKQCSSIFPVTKDFSNQTFTVTFTANSPAESKSIFVPIVDDDINEASEFFVAIVELIDAVDPERVTFNQRSATLCEITDNDGKLFNFMHRYINQHCQSLSIIHGIAEHLSIR